MTSFLRASVCASVRLSVRTLKSGMAVKSPKSKNDFVGVPYYAAKNFQPNHQRRKIAMSRSPQSGSLRHFQGKCNHQGDFVGGPKLKNNKSKMADGRHLGSGVSQPALDRFAQNLVCCFILATRGQLGTQNGIRWKSRVTDGGHFVKFKIAISP